MVKLLRLTSDKDDDFINAQDGLVFSVNMDDDLIVSPDAKIALKNLTFESDFTAFTTDINNGLLSVRYDTVRDANSFPLTPTAYTKATYENFFTDVQTTLNRCIDTNVIGDTTTAAKSEFYGQWAIDAKAEFKTIEFKLTPALNPVIRRQFELPTDAQYSGWGVTEQLMKTQPNNSGGAIDVRIEKDTSISIADLDPPDMCLLSGKSKRENDKRDQFLSTSNPMIRWCQGNAVWCARIGILRDNGSGKEQNGFEIGLATSIPWGLYNGEILPANVKFAVRVYKNTDDLAHIVPNADFSSNPTYVDNTGVAPTNPQPAARVESDMLMISCSQSTTGSGSKTIVGQIFKDEVAVQQLFSYDIPEGSEDVALYPYIAFFDGDDAENDPAEAHSPVVTFDPFEIEEYQTGKYNELLVPTKTNLFAGYPVFAIGQDVLNYDAVGEVGVPKLDPQWFINKGTSQDSFIQSHTEIFDFMGFSNNQLTDIGSGESRIQRPFFVINTSIYPYGARIVPDNVFILAQSDNYVVVLDSQKLVSYDCSKPTRANQTRSIDVVGKRANILATIPVNNNTGIVEFQANEVLYIDFDNKGETPIRNLRLRVLDKSLQPIPVQGMSVMTLLIKDE